MCCDIRLDNTCKQFGVLLEDATYIQFLINPTERKLASKIVTTGPVWICSTYNAKGKAACSSKQIPEPTLEAITADVDLATLREIRAQDGNALLLQYRDGTAETRVWKDRSRAESWTPEMRAMAARKAKERWNRNA